MTLQSLTEKREALRAQLKNVREIHEKGITLTLHVEMAIRNLCFEIAQVNHELRLMIRGRERLKVIRGMGERKL